MNLARICTNTVDPLEVIPPNKMAVIQALTKEVGKVIHRLVKNTLLVR